MHIFIKQHGSLFMCFKGLRSQKCLGSIFVLKALKTLKRPFYSIILYNTKVCMFSVGIFHWHDNDLQGRFSSSRGMNYIYCVALAFLELNRVNHLHISIRAVTDIRLSLHNCHSRIHDNNIITAITMICFFNK